MRVQVIAIYFADDGSAIWAYEHGEGMPNTGDPEQMALAATGKLNEHLDGAKVAIAAQSAADLKRIQGAGEEPSGS